MSGEAPGETILIIDDDDLTREGFAASLRRAGYAVILAANGREGLNLLRREARPALILLDMMMPAADGWHFLKERAQEPELQSLPVVITTGLSISCPQWAQSLGACGYLRKPITVEALSEEVRRLVKERGQRAGWNRGLGTSSLESKESTHDDNGTLPRAESGAGRPHYRGVHYPAIASGRAADYGNRGRPR